MTDEEAPTIAEVSTYRDLVAALVERRHALGLSQLEVDYLCEFADGYTGKIELGARRVIGRGTSIRGLGPKSMPALLRTLRLRLLLVADE